MTQKICAYCGKLFVAQRSTAKYCCDLHRAKDRRRRQREELTERQRAAFEGRKAAPLKDIEISDEDVLGFMMDIKAATSALIDASSRANPHLRLLCGRVGMRIRDVLNEEGLLDDER